MSDFPDYVHAIYTSVKNTWQDAENLDDTHGYTTYIWIPEETFSVDIMKLWVFAEKFRAYSKSALAGGGITKTTTATTPNHTHDVVIGTKTSVAGGAHSHTVTLATSSATTPNHTHQVTIGVKTSGAVSDIIADVYVASSVAAHDAGYLITGYYYTDLPTSTHSHQVDVGTPTSESGGASHTHTVSGQTAEAVIDHTHDVVIGTVTSASGGASHTHDVTLDDHVHSIDFGIYEESIAGQTLSAILYDPDNVELKDFGVLLTGEDNDEIDLSSYFETLKYGMYKLVLSVSGRMRVRCVFYELCKMYAQY